MGSEDGAVEEDAAGDGVVEDGSVGDVSVMSFFLFQAAVYGRRGGISSRLVRVVLVNMRVSL